MIPFRAHNSLLHSGEGAATADLKELESRKRRCTAEAQIHEISSTSNEQEQFRKNTSAKRPGCGRLSASDRQESCSRTDEVQQDAKRLASNPQKERPRKKTQVLGTLDALNLRNSTVQDKKCLTNPLPFFSPCGEVSQSPDNFKISPVPAKRPRLEYYQGSSGSKSTNPSTRKYQDTVGESSKMSAENKMLHLNKRYFILSRILYKYTRMLIAFRCNSGTKGRISKLLGECPDDFSSVKYKRVSIDTFNKDNKLPPGLLVKFCSPPEAMRAHREVTLKLRSQVQTLPMDELMQAVATLEASQQTILPTTLTIRSKKKQDSAPNTKELEALLRNYGDLRSVQYQKKDAGVELVYEAVYDCVTHGLLAVVALDSSYPQGLGALHVQFKKCEVNENLLPKIADIVEKRLRKQGC